MTAIGDDGEGMTSLTALLWSAEHSARIEFSPGACCVTIPTNNIIGHGSGSSGQAFITAVMNIRKQLSCASRSATSGK